MRAFRWLLRLLPRDLREAFGEEMEADLALRLAAARGLMGRLGVWVSASADLAGVALAERRSCSTALESTAHDLRMGARMIKRSPGLALSVVGTLALGAAVPLAVFTVVRAVVLEAPPYPDPEEVVLMVTPWDDASMYPELSGTPGLRGVSPFTLGRGTMLGPAGAEPVRTIQVGTGFFDLLSVRMRGRSFSARDHEPTAPRAAVVSMELWERQFGAVRAPRGELLELSGIEYTIVGILPRRFTLAMYEGVDVWLPLAAGFDGSAGAFGRLEPRADLEAVSARLSERIEARAGEERVREWADQGRPAAQLRRVDELQAELHRGLLALLGAAMVVFLIACGNAANLLFIRALRRNEEMRVRRALGAPARRLALQLLTESGLLSGVAVVAALGLALAATRLLLSFSPGYLPGNAAIGMHGLVLAFAVPLTVAMSVLGGSLPAWVAVRGAPTRVRGGSGPGTRWVQSTLVVSQIAGALVMLTGSALLLQTYRALRPTEPGFRVEGLTVVSVPVSRDRFAAPTEVVPVSLRALQAYRSHPGVRRAELVNYLPLTGMSWYMDVVAVDGRPLAEGARAGAHLRVATPGYADLMEIELLRGRAPEAPREVWINETAARRLWQDRDPLGRTFTLEDRPTPVTRTVVGVVRDGRVMGGTTSSSPVVYSDWAEGPAYDFQVILETSTPMTLATARSILGGVDAELPVQSVAPLERVVGESVRQPRFELTLVGSMGVLGLLLAVAGSFAVLSSFVERRRRDLAIRKALGARAQRLLGAVLLRGGSLVAVGILVGVGLSLWLADAFGRAVFLYQVEARDPRSIALAVVTVGIAGLVASVLPAVRAARSDPMSALKE